MKSKELNKIADTLGLKRSAIAEMIGITPQALYMKMNNIGSNKLSDEEFKLFLAKFKDKARALSLIE